MRRWSADAVDHRGRAFAELGSPGSASSASSAGSAGSDLELTDDIWYEPWFYRLGDVPHESPERAAIVACMHADLTALRRVGEFDVSCADYYSVRMSVDTGSVECLLELLRRAPGLSLCLDGHWPVRKSVYNDDPAMLDCLLSHGASAHVPEALRDAACENSAGCLRVLLAHGARAEEWVLECARRFGAREALSVLGKDAPSVLGKDALWEPGKDALWESVEDEPAGPDSAEDVRGADPVMGVAPFLA